MIGPTSQTFKMGRPTTAAVMQYFCHLLSWSSTLYTRSLIDWSNGRSFETWQCFCGSPLLSMAFGWDNHWDRWLSTIGQPVWWSSYGFHSGNHQVPWFSMVVLHCHIPLPRLIPLYIWTETSHLALLGCMDQATLLFRKQFFGHFCAHFYAWNLSCVFVVCSVSLWLIRRI